MKTLALLLRTARYLYFMVYLTPTMFLRLVILVMTATPISARTLHLCSGPSICEPFGLSVYRGLTPDVASSCLITAAQ